MASDSDRDLRRLAKRFRIFFIPPNENVSDKWPATHRPMFEEICNIRGIKFNNYCASSDISSNEEPWKKETKNRAKWLATRSSQLTKQRRNEAGWRFSIENAILHRFRFEVAW